MTTNGRMLPEEEKEIEAIIARIAVMDVPELPEYLRPKPLASAVARGLTHAQHKAEWKAKHESVGSVNNQDQPRQSAASQVQEP